MDKATQTEEQPNTENITETNDKTNKSNEYKYDTHEALNLLFNQKFSDTQNKNYYLFKVFDTYDVS